MAIIRNCYRMYNIIILMLVLTFIFPTVKSFGVERIVDLYGQLRVEGNRIVNQHGEAIALRGMSLFWSQWIGKYYNYDCIEWLRDDWQCTVVRAALAVESGGYLSNPVTEMDKVKIVIDACLDLGIYVIIDWHDHHAEDHQEEAIAFFQDIASEYGEYPNIIYEIYNEPLIISWPAVIKPYAEAVIAEIRAIDPDNIIVVGNPTWSQDVDVAAKNPIEGSNIAYSLHFYAATHKKSLRDKATIALNKGAALWVTEFGTCESNGSGVLDYAESQKWFDFMDQNMISWCNWSIADKNETSAALKSGASATGNWSDSDLSDSGALIREKIIAWNQNITAVQEPIAEGVTHFYVLQNFPNPFNPATQIRYQVQAAGHVRLDIYNVLGSHIATLIDEPQQPGYHTITFDGSHLCSGVYFARLTMKPDNGASAGKPSLRTIKMLLTK